MQVILICCALSRDSGGSERGFKWVGIIAIKTERTQIHFLSDVLVAVASLDLKVPNEGNWWRIYFVWLNKLAFLMEGKHNLLSTFGINVREVYIKVLNNSRLYLGI